MDKVNRGMSHIRGGMEWNSARFHQAVQNDVQFKTSKFFISGLFHLTFSDCS